MFHSYMNKDRHGTGGVLFLLSTAMLAVMMVFTITFIRISTAKSVAESVEHTIALQCLASAYLHPTKYSDTNTWTSNKTFDAITTGSDPINPLQQFNDTMKAYNLMKHGERSGQADGTADEWIAMKYIKKDSTSLSPEGKPLSTFEIQIGGWTCYDNWWDAAWPIVPNSAKVTIETSGYTPNIR